MLPARRKPVTEPFKDYYRVLRVRPTAGAAEIKAAFRRLASQHHPDVATATRSSRRFPEIVEAYEVLADPQKRRRYDRLYCQRRRPVRRRRAFGLGIDVLGLRIGLFVGTLEDSRKGYKRGSTGRHAGPEGGR
jgi:curved DNA-binding protein CbpA